MSTAYAATLAEWTRPIAAHALLTKAEALTGLADWGGRRWQEDRFRYDFRVLCESIESTADLSAQGRSRTHSRLITMLVSRLRYLAARKGSADADGQKIVAPLIGTGMPRAGTTFFHGLIAQDPANRAVAAWEAAMPVPDDAIDRRWALKGPGHLYAWDELLIAFPDAKIYINHRDPGKVIPSIASLFAKLRSLLSDAAIDRFELGQAQLAGWEYAVAGYAAIQLTEWRYRSLDYQRIQSSLTAAQSAVDADGMVRVVIARHEPGVWNWLDTDNQQRVFTILRWQRMQPDGPALQSCLRLTTIDRLRAGLPVGTRWIRPEERAEQLANRIAAYRRRIT